MGLKKEEIPIVPSFINVYKAMEQLLLSVTPTEDAHTHTHTLPCARGLATPPHGTAPALTLFPAVRAWFPRGSREQHREVGNF